MNYRDYVQKPILHEIMPRLARPKATKGDTHRRRFINSHPAEQQRVEVYGIKSGRLRIRKEK